MRRRLLLAAVAALVLAGGVLWAVRARYGGPVRVVKVAPGILVAGQPRADEWAGVLEDHAVRTVVNLRGPRTRERWYAEEVAACRERGIPRDDVRIKLDDWPPQHEVRRFVALLEAGERPLLLHCKDGYDRSGWGAAVALALAGEPIERALAPLSPAAGHLCRRDTCPLHRFFAEYELRLAETGTAHDAATFRAWALEHYCPPPYDAAVELQAPPPPRARAADTVTLWVSVTNRSRQTWTLSENPERGIRLGARCIGPYDGAPADPLAIFRTANGPAHDLARAGLETAEIPPGGGRSFALRFVAPSAPGSYVVAVDMVDEHVHWFSDLGGPGVVFPLEVTPR